eukprot:CAMPEP_0113564048 /NCGR_PEP_ID=MMETSP0015_2-20120614/21397_1 /TAXON_ID=2838 /ORGANISM="Odontella" /LENGTH=427 /DNA_ID=CAMNT_0000466075 /DNA_START=241 /DNA_END=1524 /DNA_ORIENTATION=+ /assembly_acc=CAM_ASM_000160
MKKSNGRSHRVKNDVVRLFLPTLNCLIPVIVIARCKEAAAFQTVSFAGSHNTRNAIGCPVYQCNLGVPRKRVAVGGHGQMNSCNGCRESRRSAPFRLWSTVKRKLSGRREIFSRITLNANIPGGASGVTETELARLRHENDILKDLVAELEEENRKLESRPPQRIVIETFEGEGRPMLDANGDEVQLWYETGDGDSGKTEGLNWELARTSDGDGSTMAIAEDVSCGEDEDEDSCPIEPNLSFTDALRDRAYWLVGLLAMQSMSGFILARNEELLQTHPVIVYFLTMLVGAGGNAGNQASVRVIRGLALGTLNEQTQRRFLNREFKMALSLSTVLSLAGFTRAAVFRTPFAETIAVTTSLSLIVFSSICLGAVLPLFLKKLGVDPAHSSTTIQVVMDILGVVMTVIISTTLLDSPTGQALIARLSWGG